MTRIDRPRRPGGAAAARAHAAVRGDTAAARPHVVVSRGVTAVPCRATAGDGVAAGGREARA